MHNNDTALCEPELGRCKEICFIKEMLLKKEGLEDRELLSLCVVGCSLSHLHV